MESSLVKLKVMEDQMVFVKGSEGFSQVVEGRAKKNDSSDRIVRTIKSRPEVIK